MEFFYKYILPISVIEVIAAIVGTYYLINKKVKGVDKWIVYYLWLVILVESYGFIVAFGMHTKYEYFGFLENSFFGRGRWAYNIFTFVHYTILIFYFLKFLKDSYIKMVIKVLFVVFAIGSTYFLTNLEYLISLNISFLSMFGSFLLLITILLFFLNVLRGDKILNLKRYFPFYVAVGFLFFILCTTPIDIYFKHYDIIENRMFVNLRANVYLYVNLFLYSLLTLGFIVCSREKKSY